MVLSAWPGGGWQGRLPKEGPDFVPVHFGKGPEELMPHKYCSLHPTHHMVSLAGSPLFCSSKGAIHLERKRECLTTLE